MAATTPSLSTDISNLIPMIYEKARMTILEKPLMRQLVSSFDIAGKAGNQITIPKFNTVTAIGLNETTDLDSGTAVSTSGITLSVSEAGAQTVLTDQAVEDASEDVMAKHGEILGTAIATKDDVDALALFTSLTQAPAAGTAATTIDLSLAAHTAALTILRSSNAVGDPQAVYHPYAYHALAMALLTNANYGALRPIVDGGIAERFRAKELLGVAVYESGNITVTTPGASGNCVNAMFTQGCFGRTNKRSLKIEKERNASFRRWELNATTRYGYAKVENTWGVKIPSKCVAP